MWAKIYKLLLISKGNYDNEIGKFFKTLVIIVISPFIAITLLIGGIFSDGIGFNHNLISDLFNGNPITDLNDDQKDFIDNIQNDLLFIDSQMEVINNSLSDGSSLNVYQIKGYFIGYMLSSEHRKFTENELELWVKSFTVEDENNVYPTSVNSTIYSNLNKNLNLNLSVNLQNLMENVYSGLIGNNNGTVTTLSKEEIQKLLNSLPENTSELRKKIVIQAADSVGKIPYYWGGYATLPGYNGNDFGKVISPDEKGRNKKGLDCSHFVDWVYWTVMNDNLGNTNTTGLIKKCKKISVSELQAGDLAFLMDKNGRTTHVGIYAGTNVKGELVWIHENANDNNVAINTVSYWSGYYRLNMMEGK